MKYGEVKNAPTLRTISNALPYTNPDKKEYALRKQSESIYQDLDAIREMNKKARERELAKKARELARYKETREYKRKERKRIKKAARVVLNKANS